MKVLVVNPPTKYTKNVIRDLIYGCWCKGRRIGGAKVPPLNLLYIAAVLTEDDHRVRFLDALAERRSASDVIKEAETQDLLVISTSTMSFREDTELLDAVKKRNPSIRTLIFGSHPTFQPHSCLEDRNIDIIVRGEPEFVIRDTVRALEKGTSLGDIKGIGFRDGDSPILTGSNPPISNLDELPIPDRALLPRDVDYFNPLAKRVPYTTLMTSRGCSGNCNFCTVPPFYGNKVRYRSAESVLQELETLEGLGYREVWFRDETFTLLKKRNQKIFEGMKKRDLGLTWICNSRVDTIDREAMALMKAAGCHTIKFGVESGVQEILDNLQKGITIEQTERVFRWAHEVGMDTHAHVMLGSPGETRETIEKTIEFVKKIDPTTATFGICTPYAGTELFKNVLGEHPEIEDGSRIHFGGLHTESFFNEYFTDLEKGELEHYVRIAYRRFYLRPQYLLKWLKRIRDIEEFRRVSLAGANVIGFLMERSVSR
jgi:radical SAM superfamily enzyme YgiQ (UPF0313 family)